MIKPCSRAMGYLISTLCLSVPTAAVCGQEPDSPRTDGARKSTVDPATPDRQRVRITEQKQVTPRMRIQQLPELRKLMWEGLRLDDHQKELIKKLFDDEISDLRRSIAIREEGREQEAMTEVRGLQRKLVEAQKAGDVERAREYRNRIGTVLKTQLGGSNPGNFIVSVERVLRAEQRDSFRQMVSQMGWPLPRSRSHRELTVLRRAALAPEVRLSDEQRRRVLRLIRDHQAARHADESEASRSETARKLRAEIEAILTPEQREIFVRKIGKLDQQ